MASREDRAYTDRQDMLDEAAEARHYAGHEDRIAGCETCDRVAAEDAEEALWAAEDAAARA